MCGIVGYIGVKTQDILLNGLKKLEYRGYDSSGVAFIEKNEINVFKAKGEIKNLESVLPFDNSSCIGIGHTRWATHGKPDEINAHPHISSDKEWAVVHNGIIENYVKLKEKLTDSGYGFYSETDTETVAKLLEYYKNKGYDNLNSLCKTVSAIKGSFALCIINNNFDGIYFAKNKSPLFIARKNKEVMVASDIICFKGFSDEYYALPDGVFGFAREDKTEFYDNFGKISLSPLPLKLGEYDNLNAYKNYMIKEIYETKNVVKNIIEYYGEPENRNIFNCELSAIDKIKLVGCGTAYHACLLGAEMIGKKTEIETTAVVASEFRYGNLCLDSKTLVILVSQSGETADTLGAFERAKEQGALTVGVVNVEYSSLSKKVDFFLPIKAGVEIAVASTKAFSAQVCVLNILAGIIAEKLSIKNDPLADIKALYENFDYGNAGNYKLLAEVLKYNDKLFMIGRGADYYVAQEASLKIKETSYINVDTYYAGELKHGFLALIDEDSFVIVFATDNKTFEKTLSNAEEAKARGGKIILFTCFDIAENDAENFYHVIKVKQLGNSLQAVLNILPWQIIAYYVSVSKGINPDKPRNLAKSVTVE